MIKLLTAHTSELDDPEKAVQEILDQLNLAERGLKNSIALLFCHAEFIDQGIMQTLCKKLPFETLGCTSQYFAASGAADEILLTLTVLTSDDTEFAAGVSEALDENNVEPGIHALYRKTAGSLSAAPSLIFLIEPTLHNLGGDIMSTSLFRACGDIPVFGTCAMDADTRLRNPQTIFNGLAYRDRLTLLLINGPVKPRFFSALFPEKAAFAQDAVITAVKGNRIISINNVSAASFMEKMGFVYGNISMLYAIPMILHYAKKPPEVMLINGIGSDGSLVCSRSPNVGGNLNIGSITAGYVLKSAEVLSHAVKNAGGGEGLFIFSCFSRIVALGGDPMAEIKVIQKELAGFPVPYLFFYSGGEICPVYISQGQMANQFYQYALVACLF